MTSQNREKIFSIIKISALVLVPLFFLITPTKTLENGPSLCIFRNLTGIPCPACGTTRGISCIFHGNFIKAFEYNKLLIISFPLLVFFWFKFFKTNFHKLTKNIDK